MLSDHKCSTLRAIEQWLEREDKSFTRILRDPRLLGVPRGGLRHHHPGLGPARAGLHRGTGRRPRRGYGRGTVRRARLDPVPPSPQPGPGLRIGPRWRGCLPSRPVRRGGRPHRRAQLPRRQMLSAVEADDAAAFASALHALLDCVRRAGSPMAEDTLVASELSCRTQILASRERGRCCPMRLIPD